jgi:hypothetical protein
VAVNFIFWAGQGATDIHLVAGVTSRTLNDLLVINLGATAVFGTTPPPSVTVSFTANFIGTLTAGKFSGFGVTVDANTGAVSVASPIPGPPLLRNFLVRAVVTDASVTPTAVFTQEIRFHVHQSVTSAWLTPDTLDLRRGAEGLRFSVLAEFDDKVVGDISNIAGTAWTAPAGGAVSVDPNTGGLTVSTDSVPSTTIQAQLPALYGAKVCTGTVRTLVPWSGTQVTAKLVPGSAGAARMSEVPNFLFLPDGFLPGEQAAFEQRALTFINFLRTSPAARPFDVCSPEINFWTAWVESQERGTSPLYEIVPQQFAGGLSGTELPPAAAPPASVTQWNISQMIHEVGLPVAAHAGVGFGAQVLEWSLVYGVAVTLHVTAALHAAWMALANRSLVNEQNTAFGIALGERPSVVPANPPRSPALHPFRTTRAQLDPFFASIRDAAAPAGPAIGGVWGPGGKDRPFAVMLCAGSRYGGAGTPPPNELIAVGLTEERNVGIAPVVPTGGFDLQPFGIPATSPLDTMCRVAHESAHSLRLGDEYGGAPALTPDRLPDIAGYLNLQDVASSSLPAPQKGLDPALLRWNWPRITKAGVLTAAPQAVGSDYQITLKAGHGAKFAVGDFVRLRTRPLTVGVLPGIVPSTELTVTAKAGDTLTVEPGIPLLFFPSVFVAGSIVYVQRETAPVAPATRGNPLGLISPTVLAYMTMSKIPLNIAPVAPGAWVCSPDSNVVQPAQNKPAALPAGKPKYSAWIVGAFEGGLTFYCGVLHPTGACVMRQLVLPEDKAMEAFNTKHFAYRFCPVCRYILVDRLDPSQHGVIDALYQKQYAEP